MKANELRIGNYIWLESKQKEYQISSGHDIEEIDDAPLNFDAQQIPLTKEWLLKLGFIQQGVIINNNGFTEQCGINYFIKNNIVYSLSDNQVELDNPNVFLCNLKYVHQLQNLYFALTGKELTFKSE